MKFRIKHSDEAKLVEVELALDGVRLVIDDRVVATVRGDGSVELTKESFSALGLKPDSTWGFK